MDGREGGVGTGSKRGRPGWDHSVSENSEFWFWCALFRGCDILSWYFLARVLVIIVG